MRLNEEALIDATMAFLEDRKKADKRWEKAFNDMSYLDYLEKKIPNVDISYKPSISKAIRVYLSALSHKKTKKDTPND